MGVTHKLRPEVRNFIIEQKNLNPNLSCRKLTTLVLNNYKVDLSKSSINMIIKEAGLSAPVGRTPKKKRQHIVMPKLPVLLEDVSVKKAAAPEEEPIQKAREAEGLRLAKLEEERKLQEEVFKKAQEEKLAQEKARLEEEARQEEIKKAQALAEQKIKEEAEKLRALKFEEDKKRQEEEARKAQEEETKKAQEEELVRQLEARRQAEEEEARKAQEEEAAKKAEEEKKPAIFSVARIPQLENTGIVLLRAVDSIIGLSKLISTAIKNRFPGAEGNFDDLTENIIYLPLAEGKIDRALEDRLNACLSEIEKIKVMNLDISRMINLGLQEARCVRASLSDGTNLYLDGQFYSVWSSPYVPYDFASPLHNLRKQINKYFNTDSPFILFNAPGYDIPSQEFFSFLASLDAKGNGINKFIIYGNKLEELEVLPVSQTRKHFFIFGVWPWQFTECRKVKGIGDFRLYRLEEQERDVFIADIEMELFIPGTGKQVSLRGSALKTGLNEKTRMVILSNFSPEAKSAEEITSLYLNHWPNLDEAFQDYSRKIELFTYTANSQRFFNAGNLELDLNQTLSLKEIFKNYLVALDAYARWHFLPSGYEDKEFAVTKERFYDLGARLKNSQENCRAEFILPQEGFAFGKDLAYLCRRLNEREVVLDGKRFLAQA